MDLGPEVSGNLWRTTGDIRDSWDSMTKIGFGQNDLAKWAAPGHWNDPDMLEIGNGGMSKYEYQVHMSLWSMLSAPLLAGNDLRTATPEILAILTNPEVIKIDQDPAGHQATGLSVNGEQEIWVKDLADGGQGDRRYSIAEHSRPVCRSNGRMPGIKGKHKVRDLWANRMSSGMMPDIRRRCRVMEWL